ncbi:Crp/Fnr family transcriptional regulator [Acidisphaera sp. L21]|uniref:Crp/Fnr family transcriptional regulator n=1 Tax=Acidisphaera sp. L21 TaxID=1641851 RepID=UPI00131D2379|nr:cyclic nucleotide-binding domain-containing protein [Acidisphaera sp. L21]
MRLFDYSGAGDAVPAGPKPVSWSLTEDEWEGIRRYAAERRYAPGGQIIAAGEVSDALHIVVEGQVALDAGGAAPEAVGPGSAFGVAGFLTAGPSVLGATAVSAATLLLLPRAGLDQLASWTPAVALTLLRDLAGFAAEKLHQAHLAA